MAKRETFIYLKGEDVIPLLTASWLYFTWGMGNTGQKGGMEKHRQAQYTQAEKKVRGDRRVCKRRQTKYIQGIYTYALI